MKRLFMLGTLCLGMLTANAQVGVGTLTPDSKAELDVYSTTRGMLLPRLTHAQRDAITSPPDGLLIYQTNDSIGLTEFRVDRWVHLIGANDLASLSSGGGAIIPFASGLPVTVTSLVSGAVGTSALVGFGSAVSGVSLLGGSSIDLTGAGGTLLNFAFSMPRSGTLRSISAYFSVTAGINIGAGPIMITAQLYRSVTPNSTFVPVPGAAVTLPPLSGTLNLGTTINNMVSGLNITVNAQERYLLVFSSTSSGGIATSATGYASAGMSID